MSGHENPSTSGTGEDMAGESATEANDCSHQEGPPVCSTSIAERPTPDFGRETLGSGNLTPAIGEQTPESGQQTPIFGQQSGEFGQQTLQEPISLEHLDSLLSTLHPTLRTKPPGADETSFRTADEAPPGAALLAAEQLSSVVQSLRSPALGPVINRVLPCVLTAVDHWSPPVKIQGLSALRHLVENVTAAELGWFGEVVMDALCKSAVGSDEDVWPVVLPVIVRATVKIAGRDPRNKWYSHVFSLLLRDMELHYSDAPRRRIWLRETPPLVNALGLFVVGHFKRLMPLLLTWIRTPDEETQNRTVDMLTLVIANTWPRMPVHADRLTSELRKASEESASGHERTETRAKIEEACRFLQRCKEHDQRCNAIESH